MHKGDSYTRVANELSFFMLFYLLAHAQLNGPITAEGRGVYMRGKGYDMIEAWYRQEKGC